MKKTKLNIILVILLGCLFVIPSEPIKANEINPSQNITYTRVQIGEDLYEETIIYENTLTRASKNGSKTINYRNSAGTIVWSVSVHGNFTYNGSTSTCISSTVSTTCPSSVWKIRSKSASKSGNTAIGNVTASRYFNGTIVETLSRQVRLSCSKSGVLS